MAVVKSNILGLQLGKVPILKPLIALVLGICIGYYTNFYHFSYWLALLVVFAIFQVVSFRSRKVNWGRLLFPWAFYFFWLTLGIWTTVRTTAAYQLSYFSKFEFESLFVVIDGEPQVKGDNIRFPVSVKAIVHEGEKQHAVGKIMVSLRKDTIKEITLNYGDLLLVQNRMQPTKPPTNPNEFDYRKYLKHKDIIHQCFLMPHQLIKVDTQQGNLLIAKAMALREKMIHKFALYINDNNALQLALALIFGYKSQIDEDTVEVFRNTGTIHILSVSGLHVGLVFGLLTLLLRWMNRFPYGRYLRVFLILAAIWFYVILTGMSPPILRAGIMITFFVLSMMMNRTQFSLNTLLASALFILLFSPKSLFDIGFQLSYLAVLGILLLHPLFTFFYIPTQYLLRVIFEYTYISVAAQLFTLPLILYYFGQFPSYFIPANLFIALPITAVMYLGVLLVLSPFTFLNYYVGLALQELLRFCIAGLGYFERLPAAVLKGIVWNEIQVVLAFFSLIMLIWAWNFKEKKAVFISLLILMAFSLTTSIQHIKRRSYSGYRVYNVRSEVSIAHVNKGKVILYSTFDSLRYKGNVFAVLPDLRQFVQEDEIEFVKLPVAGKQNYTVSLGIKKILILEGEFTDTVKNVDLVLWRKNNRNTLQQIDNGDGAPPVVIVDGSNSDKTIAFLEFDKDIHAKQLYILKNNFAYVWDEE